MKKLQIITLFIFLCIFIGSTVFALGNFLYTDTDSNIRFTIPEGWEYISVDSSEQYVDAKFSYSGKDGGLIAYGSTDLLESVPAPEKKKINRLGINNSYFTTSDIANMYGTTADRVTKCTYNGKEYYCTDIITATTDHGTLSDVTSTNLVRIENGWMYVFFFDNVNSSEQYEDFEMILNSVEYLDTSDKDNVPHTTDAYDVSESDTGDNGIEPSVLFAIILGLIMTAAAYIFVPVIIALTRKKFTKKAIKKIVLLNGICVFAIFTFLNNAAGTNTTGNLTAACLWSGVVQCMLYKTSLKK